MLIKSGLTHSILAVHLFLLALSGCGNEHPDKESLVVGIVNPHKDKTIIVDGLIEKLNELTDHGRKEIKFLQPTILNDSDIDQALESMKAENVDLLVTITTPPTRKAKKAFKKKQTPIVFAPIHDPIQAGIVDQLLKNDDNITGIKTGGSNAKALEWLMRIKPDTARILVPFSGSSKVETISFNSLQVAAEKLGVELVRKETKTLDDLYRALDKIPQDIDAIWLLHSIFLAPNVNIFVESAIKNRRLLASGTGLAHLGVMISYGQYYYNTGKQAGRLAHQILNGVSAGDIPIETADFFLCINLKSASAAGIEIPDELLGQAQEIYLN